MKAATRIALFMSLAATLPACLPSPARPEHPSRGERCAYRHPSSVPASLTGALDCRQLWQLHVEMLVSRNKPGRAVESYRRWVSRRGADRRALRHLTVSLMSRALAHEDPAVRIAAIQAARLADARELKADLARRLGDPDGVVRTWAAVVLPDVAEGASLLYRQLRSKHTMSRVVAARAVGRLFGAAAIPALRGATRDGDPRVRSAALIGLEATRNRAALEVALPLLEDVLPAVRAEAIRTLVGLDARRGCEVASPLVGDASQAVRRAAVRALTRCAGRRRLLVTVARGRDVSLALIASEALARGGDARPLVAAVAAGVASDRWSTRVDSLAAAGAVRNPDLGRLALGAMQDREPRVRLAAAEAALAQGEREAALGAALSLRSMFCGAGADVERICLRASELLGRADHGGGLSSLQELARRGRSSATRIVALRTLLQTVDGERMALRALVDPDARVALTATAWLYRRTL